MSSNNGGLPNQTGVNPASSSQKEEKEIENSVSSEGFKHCQINPDTASKAEIKEEIKRLESLANEWQNEEMSIKILINSFYGALGNKWFIAFNPDVAEAVTIQGQDLIKSAEKYIDKYFHEYWHKDKELHDNLGIKGEVRPITKPMVVYCDTDSNYVSFEEVFNSCEFGGSPKELILKINQYRLEEYLSKCFKVYASKWQTENFQDFELESISEAGIWLGKKKYVLNPIWSEGINIPTLSKIKSTGVEIIQSSTPPFVRKKLTEILRYIFEKKDKLSINELVEKLKKIRDEFRLQDPSNISKVTTANNIEKFIVCDIKDKNFEITKGCPIHVRGAGYYNWLLNNNEKFKNKYELIKSGEKVKFYYVATQTDTEQNVFSFVPGTYPYEFAPDIDFSEQFRHTVLDPINRFVEVMGFPIISSNLYVQSAIF